MQLKNKTVVLTGAQGGIGRHLLKLLKEHGAHVIAIGRTEEDGIKKADLSDINSISILCDDLKKINVDVLINLAGQMYFGETSKQTTANLESMITVNLTAPIKLAQAVLPNMLAKKKGQIVNIGSIFGSLPFPYFSVYSSTKAGLKGFSDSLRREYFDRGISVSHISPRAVDTPFNNQSINKFNERTRANIDSPEKVAKIIINSITNDKRDVKIGLSESIFTKINAIAPSIIDRSLGTQRFIASQILEGENL